MRWAAVGGLIGLAAIIETVTGAPLVMVVAFVILALVALVAAVRKVRPSPPVALPLAGARWADGNDADRLASPGAFLLTY